MRTDSRTKFESMGGKGHPLLPVPQANKKSLGPTGHRQELAPRGSHRGRGRPRPLGERRQGPSPKAPHTTERAQLTAISRSTTRLRAKYTEASGTGHRAAAAHSCRNGPTARMATRRARGSTCGAWHAPQGAHGTVHRTSGRHTAMPLAAQPTMAALREPHARATNRELSQPARPGGDRQHRS